MKKAMVIGLGHPRSGTTSLYSLLDRQQFLHVTHESFIKLPWVPCAQYFNFTYQNIVAYNSPMVGEVAFYFLNYVPWFARHNFIKFVCMKRDKNKTMASLQKLFNAFETNHLIDVTSKHWNPKWRLDTQEALLYRNAFPKYDLSPEAALNQYYEDYYNTVKILQDKYPDHFKVFDTETTFNSEEGQKALLVDYLGLESPLYFEGIKVYKDIKTHGEE